MLLIAIGYACYAFGVVFIACEIVQHVCDAINSFDMRIVQIDWYLYPIEMKKMLPVIINLAQKPVVIKGFGSMPTDRELFKKVNKYNAYQANRSTL